MAGSISDNIEVYKKKSFAYVPPATPSDLLESTSITIDFVARKFIHIGLDPTSKDCEVIIRIITPSRYVHITYYTLKRIFSLMGNILSFILNIPEKYKRTIFYETETEKISSMVYGGENVLVVETKNQEGCRVLLSRSDLICLQHLEGSIFEIIHRTTSNSHILFTKQVRGYVKYLEQKFTQMHSPPVNEEENYTIHKEEHRLPDRTIGASHDSANSVIRCCACSWSFDRTKGSKRSFGNYKIYYYYYYYI